MRVLVFGSRNLTTRHFWLMRLVLHHSMLADPLPDLETFLRTSGMDAQELALLPDTESLVLINGDGPPGKQRGAIGADKLAVLAASDVWPDRKRMRWHEVMPGPGEDWGTAAVRRDLEMAEDSPDRCYCVHTDLDASKGSAVAARALSRLSIPLNYVRVTQAGALVSVQLRLGEGTRS